MDKCIDYNALFAEVQKKCSAKDWCNAFANITLDEAMELNYLLDRLLLFVENIGIEAFENEEFEFSDEILKLYRLADELFTRDLNR